MIMQNIKFSKAVSVVLYSIFCYTWVELLGLIYFYFSKGHKNGLYRPYFKLPLIILIVIFVYSLISCTYFEYDYSKLFQQFGAILLYIYLYSIFFSYARVDLRQLFIRYIKVSYYVSLLGIVQIAVYYVTNVDIFRAFSWFESPPMLGANIIRLRSICPEGGQLGTILAPAFIYCFYFNDSFRILKNKKWIIGIAALLTSAMTIVVTTIIMLYLKYVSKNKVIDFITLLVLTLGGTVFLITTISRTEKVTSSNAGFDGIIMRVQDTTDILLSLDDLDKLEDTNSSTYAWATNFYVARHAPSRLAGTGLGTHQQNYHSVYKNSNAYSYGLNAEEGYSLLNRIFSEFGYIGLVLYLFFMIRHLDRKDVISFSLFFYILSAFLRGGNYLIAGVIFFHYFYIISKEMNYGKNNKRNNCNF